MISSSVSLPNGSRRWSHTVGRSEMCREASVVRGWSHAFERPGARGFTLLEIMVAMTLFTMIGLAVVMLMSTGVDMWLRGNRSSLREDRIEQSMPRLIQDARAILVPPQFDRIPFDLKNPDPDKEPEPVVPDNRMNSGYLNYKAADRDIRVRYWAFVRSIDGMGEMDDYVARAGTNPQANSYIDGIEDEDEFSKNLHLPTGGAAEVLWIFVPDTTRPGLGTVSRAFRSPIGGQGTLLDPKNYDTLAKLQNTIKPQKMFADVLHFDLLFWTQFTTTWEWDQNEPRVWARPGSAAAASAGTPECGPSATWDSTRGIMQMDQFKLSRGDASKNRSSDDVWPRRVRVEFALSEENTRLVDAIGQTDREVRIDSPEFGTGSGELAGHLMKIGEEWVEINEREERDILSLARRGMRGTKANSHGEMAIIRYGRMVDFTIPLPAHRDDNN